MWLRFKVALLVVLKGEDSFLKPYRDEAVEAQKACLAAEAERDFAVQALQLMSNEAMTHIKNLEAALDQQKQRNEYGVLSSLRFNKDDLPN
ncbi:MAG: hypothetical protein GY915_02560 [bacterium]|nr:hypothetical protein [bacterium]